MKDVLIIIPTYNEIENIEKIIISTINLYPKIKILVVDDNSPDLTFKKVEELKLKFKDQLFLLKRLKKEGLGTAYVAGFKWALKNKFNYSRGDPNPEQNFYKIDKKVFVCDSFAGLPKPSGKFIQDDGDTHYTQTKLAISLEQVQNHFKIFKCLDSASGFSDCRGI